jgi:HAD superfamily hydrolase (TIGR01509 family)
MLIFDMDGTLIDSNGIWRTVDETFLARRGLPYTRAYYDGVAHTVFPLAAKFTKEFCHLSESTDEIMAEWMELAGDMYATSVAVKPGVEDYLRRCRDSGETMIVLTSSVPEHCRMAFGHLDLERYFDRILFAQEMGLDKKNPAVFQQAAELMGVAPERCTLFDDSVTSCRSAKTAGMTVVGVYDAFFHVSWDEMQTVCDRTIRSFEELL